MQSEVLWSWKHFNDKFKSSIGGPKGNLSTGKSVYREETHKTLAKQRQLKKLKMMRYNGYEEQRMESNLRLPKDEMKIV